jgi:hypothetical protein
MKSIAEVTMKNVLTLIHDDAGQEARFQAALDLTRALDGHLICLDVIALPLVTADFTGESMNLVMRESEAAADRNQARIEDRLSREDVSWEWQGTLGDVVKCVTEASGLADIIVLNRKLEGFPFPNAGEIAASTAIQSNKPVVAVPENTRSFAVKGTALIAWDGSAAVANTVSRCVPLLQQAKSVQMYTVRDGWMGIPPEEAAEYLSRHGIHPSISYHTRITDPIHDLIQRQCDRVAADYCVMGAYGHSRVVERLFGGVTRRMLAESAIPLVLGH